MLTAGWHAHTLNAPGKFLISAAEHDTPRRARAYLLTDQAVEAAATYYADYRPPLDRSPSKQQDRDQPERLVVPPDTDTMTAEDAQDGPDASCGPHCHRPARRHHRPRPDDRDRHEPPWIYLRLRDLAEQATSSKSAAVAGEP